jgi:hypothetical protein
MLNLYAERRRRQLDFVARQLAEFYGPLLGLRSAIRTHGELRVKLEAAQDASWRELVRTAREDGGVGVIQRLREGPLGKQYDAMIDEENRHFRENIMPLYRRMVETFRDKISLAETPTRQHFPALIEFVEVWDRFLQGKIPGQVTQTLGHTEKNVHPLYANLEQTHDRLQRRLAGSR